MKQPGGKRGLRMIVRILAIIAGLWGGWLAAGVLNDHRIDIPRRLVPATRPSAAAPAR